MKSHGNPAFLAAVVIYRKGCTMNRNNIFLSLRMFACGVVFLLMPMVAMADCMTESYCLSHKRVGECCCINGETGTTDYTCPSGCTLSGDTCSRSTTYGQDSTGYYTITYGTEPASNDEYDCYNYVNLSDIQNGYYDAGDCTCGV